MDAAIDTAKAEHEPHSCCQSALENILHLEKTGTVVCSNGMVRMNERRTKKVLVFS